MQKDRVPNQTIVKSLRQTSGKSVTIKDVQNVGTRADVARKSGKTEIELFDLELKEVKKRDPGVSIYPRSVDGKLHALCFATSAMKTEFRKTPEVNFLDATYNVNYERFCLYAL